MTFVLLHNLRLHLITVDYNNDTPPVHLLTSPVRGRESPVDLLAVIVALQLEKIYPPTQSRSNHLVPNQLYVRHSISTVVLPCLCPLPTAIYDALKGKEKYLITYSIIFLLPFLTFSFPVLPSQNSNRPSAHPTAIRLSTKSKHQIWCRCFLLQPPPPPLCSCS